jgi:hypothetical protein
LLTSFSHRPGQVLHPAAAPVLNINTNKPAGEPAIASTRVRLLSSDNYASCNSFRVITTSHATRSTCEDAFSRGQRARDSCAIDPRYRDAPRRISKGCLRACALNFLVASTNISKGLHRVWSSRKPSRQILPKRNRIRTTKRIMLSPPDG